MSASPQSGPLALLPLADGRCTLVLTLTRDMAERAMGWSDEEFLAEVQRRFGFRLGRFLKVGRRVAYPLSLSRARKTSAGRCVIVGNAAQGLHPVAGMGFNLGLRDAASLAELVARASRRSGQPGADCGLRRMAGGGPPRGHRIHRWPGAVVLRALGAGAAFAQSRAAGLRPVAAGKSRAVVAVDGGRGPDSQAGARCAARGAPMSREFDMVVVGFRDVVAWRAWLA